jgi:hypothetical protein
MRRGEKGCGAPAESKGRDPAHGRPLWRKGRQISKAPVPVPIQAAGRRRVIYR